MEENLSKIESFGSVILMIINIIASLIAVFQNYTWLLAISVVFLIIITIYWYKKYKKRADFIKFIEFLFYNTKHPFNLLPKICLAIDYINKYNKLSLSDMSVKFTYDMRNSSFDKFPNEPIEYTTKIEYYLKAKNKKLPDKFYYYTGNTYGEQIVNIWKQQAEQGEDKYEKVSVEEAKGGKLCVQSCSWKLEEDKKPRNSSVFPISFYVEYIEKTKNYTDTIIFYPKQFAKDIEELEISFEFLGNKVKLKEIKGFEISLDGKQFVKTGIFKFDEQKKSTESSDKIKITKANKNELCAKVKVNNTECKAYYFDIKWELIYK